MLHILFADVKWRQGQPQAKCDLQQAKLKVQKREFTCGVISGVLGWKLCCQWQAH